MVNCQMTYGALEVIHGVSLSIAEGEFIALVGPSGCGKSTLLRMIAGLEDISDGEVLIGGNVVNSLTPRERNIAMVFQSYALYPHMTAAENMGFNLKLSGVSKPEIKKLVGEAARMLALDDLLDRKPSQLSGGQRQRVAADKRRKASRKKASSKSGSHSAKSKLPDFIAPQLCETAAVAASAGTQTISEKWNVLFVHT